jgi:predicted DCC family thiol-disulfide oxidoreductase YuxK
MTPKAHIRVFYDGICSLCAREIAHYQSIAPKETFDWVDIGNNPKSFEALGYSQLEGLKLLHVQDMAGTMHIGLPAFIIIWKHLPRWHWLATLTNLPIIKPILSWVYRRFAGWRFKRQGYACRLKK